MHQGGVCSCFFECFASSLRATDEGADRADGAANNVAVRSGLFVGVGGASSCSLAVARSSTAVPAAAAAFRIDWRAAALFTAVCFTITARTVEDSSC